MANTIVLAEKPSVGRELARVLKAHTKKDGYQEGNGYIVTWALGHLIELAQPQEYDKKLEKWNMEDLPMLPEKMRLSIIKQTSHQYAIVKNLLHRSDIKDLVIATDAGREGELVARWILEKAGFKKPVKRLWISSQTDKAIKDGFAHLKPAKEYEPLYRSAVCRAEADWLVGLNVTRALTCHHNAQLSAGRVQTPTLAMIVDREDEIKRFIPKEYAQIQVKLDGFTMLYRDEKNNPRIFAIEKAAAIEKALKGNAITIEKVEKSMKKEGQPQLYDLTSLQQDANKRFGFSAKETLNIMQDLYEIHKLLTYPRTDSKYISEDIVPTLKDRLRTIAIDAYAPYANAIIKDGFKVSKRFVNNALVSDHHAIIPTDEYVDLQKLDYDEKRIYDLVIRRFLAVLSSPSSYEDTQIEGVFGPYRFTAKGKIMKTAGWKALYQGKHEGEEDEEEADQNLPNIQKGQSWKIKEVRTQKLKTSPPARYNEATLLAAMEHPEKFVRSEKMKTVLKESGGIGTVATRADIIEKLFSSNYIEKRGNAIFPLSKGIQLVSLVPEELKSPLLTAKWEEQLALIAKGKASDQSFVKEMRGYAKQLVQAVKMSDATYHHDNLTKKRCPLCDSFLLEINGKKGKMLVCSNRECGHKQNLSYQSNARCPKCHKRMQVVGEKEKKLYTCSCGFREKFDRFNEELKKRSNKASKEELQKFMRTQEKAAKQEKSAFQLALEEAQRKAGKE